MVKSKHAIAAFSLWSGMLWATSLCAQQYPVKPIRLIIPTAPGGGVDVVARALGERLSKSLGQPIIYDNRAGAGGIIGTDIAAKSSPDGYTLLIVTSAHSVNPSLYEKLPYDAVKDFTPVGLVAELSYVLSSHPGLPIKSVKDLIALAKAKPRQLNYGSAGNGSTNHMAMEYFKMRAGVDLTHVPYKGGAPATTALLAGEVQVNFSSPPHVIQHIKSGRLNGLAVTNLRRLQTLPDLPTLSESGFADYRETGWYAVLAPANTPKAIVERLNAEIVKVMRQPDLIKFYESQSIDPVSDTSPADLAKLIKSEIDRYAKIVKEAKIQIAK